MSLIMQALPFWALWWVWMAAALLLAIVEIVLPGFLFLGFAIAALLIGVLLLVAPPVLSLPMLLVGFAVLSLAAWMMLRRIFRLKDGQVRHVQGDINKH